MNVVFTICSNNYLAQAITLGNSLHVYNTDYKFIIGLVDRKNSVIDYSAIPYEILEVENIGISAFDELYTKYNITELNTAVKPFYYQYFFAGGDNNNWVIYLDPDIVVYSSFSELEKEMGASDIIITPHFTNPLNDNKFQAEEDFLNSGLYNLGFIAVKNTPEGCKMINWWAERLRHKAFIDLKRGLFTDQKWINFVPLFFKGVAILNHPGYNMAYWNLHERSLSKKKDGYFVNRTYPLVFYHFSGFNPMDPDLLSKYQDRFTLKERPDVSQLFKEYAAQLFLNGFRTFNNYPNEFDHIKKALDKKIRKERIRKIPLLLRLIRIIILKLISKYDLLLN